jgi:hypothetical protein
MRFSAQAPAAVVMVRPHAFRSNPDTLLDNAFQQHAPITACAELSATAYAEVGKMVHRLQEAGVAVHLFEDI